MCGRFTNLYRWRDLVRLMRLAYPDEELSPQFNVAPTQPAPVIRTNDANEPQGLLMKWGLVPSWATDPSVGVRSFNARCETVAEKPTFRSAFRQRRCLVPISGFYEWRVLSPREKQPYWIGRRDREPFTLAGLWERWSGHKTGAGVAATPAAAPLETFTILTTTPNSLMKPLHDRMPVILQAADRERWLAPGELDPSEASRLFQPTDDADFESFPVSKRVGDARAQGPDLMEPVNERGPDQGLLF